MGDVFLILIPDRVFKLLFNIPQNKHHPLLYYFVQSENPSTTIFAAV